MTRKAWGWVFVAMQASWVLLSVERLLLDNLTVWERAADVAFIVVILGIWLWTYLTGGVEGVKRWIGRQYEPAPPRCQNRNEGADHIGGRTDGHVRRDLLPALLGFAAVVENIVHEFGRIPFAPIHQPIVRAKRFEEAFCLEHMQQARIRRETLTLFMAAREHADGAGPRLLPNLMNELDHAPYAPQS